MKLGGIDRDFTSEASKIIEINGVKFEVDARTATLRQAQNTRISRGRADDYRNDLRPFGPSIQWG
jgi:hypothetical protein